MARGCSFAHTGPTHSRATASLSTWMHSWQRWCWGDGNFGGSGLQPLLAMNPAGLALVGADREDAIRGRDYLDFVSPPDRDRVRCLMANAFAGQPCAYDCSIVAAAQPRHFTSCFIPCPDAQGNIERLIGISADISLHRETEAELRRLNRTYAVLSRCIHSLASALLRRLSGRVPTLTFVPPVRAQAHARVHCQRRIHFQATPVHESARAEPPGRTGHG